MIAVFVIGLIWNKVFEVPVDSWAEYWWWYIFVIGIIGIGTTIWFIIGGIKDLKDLYHRLHTVKRNDLDDGIVVGHKSLSEISEKPNSTNN